MEQILETFQNMGVMLYVIIGMLILSFGFGFYSLKKNKNAASSWEQQHPNAVRIDITSGTNLITSKSLSAKVVSGEAQIFANYNGYYILSEPGDIVLELTYSYTRPGVMYKNVTTTWGPTNVELHLEKSKQYNLVFDKKEEQFNLIEK